MNRDQSFTEAYRLYSGKKWEWKDSEGKPNHPLDSSDATDRAFYLGYSYCKRETKKLTENFDNIEELKSRVQRLEKDIQNFRKIK